MKKVFWFKTFLIVVCLLGIQSMSYSQNYHVKFYLGIVEIKKQHSSVWEQVSIDMKISTNDSIRTAIESRLELADESGKSITITEKKVLRIDGTITRHFMVKDQKKKSGFFSRLKQLTQKPTGAFSSSPIAVAAIRGKAATGFQFTDANGDGINDNFIEEDNSALNNEISTINNEDLDIIRRLRDTGRHGVHNDIRPVHPTCRDCGRRKSIP